MTLYRFRFMNAVRDVFLNGAKLSDLKDLDNRGNVHHQLPSWDACLHPRPGWVVGSQANIFVANHDSERVRSISESFRIFCPLTPLMHSPDPIRPLGRLP